MTQDDPNLPENGGDAHLDNRGVILTAREANAIRMVMERGCRRQEEKVRDLLRFHFDFGPDNGTEEPLIEKMRRLGVMQ